MADQLSQLPQLRIVSPFSVHSGYAKMGRAVLRTALLAGYDVSAVESDLHVRVTRMVTDGRTLFEPFIPRPSIPLPDCQEAELRAAQKVRHREDAPTLLVQTPWNLMNWPQYGYGPVIGLTMTESDNLHPYWQHGLKNTDLTLAPSHFVHDTFRRIVPEVPSEVFPLPVDERLWTVDDHKEEIPQRPEFLFFSVFTVCERKNWRQLLIAFTEEFCKESKQVGLLLKCDTHAGVKLLADQCREMGAWVGVDTEKRTDWTMAWLYRACQCYVCPSSEGFGLPVIEAAMCGLPSVTLELGGVADTVTEETGYLCPSHMAPLVGHMPQWYDRKTDNFASFEIDELRKTLRRAYEEEKASSASGVSKGIAARENALQRYTPEVIAPRLREMVQRGIQVHSEAARKKMHPKRPIWATVAGAWGDVMCALGDVRAMMADKELENIGLIFYGRDSKISEWLRLQPWVREVIPIIEKDKAVMTTTYGKLCQVKPQYAQDEWYRLIAQRGIELCAEIAFTQLCLAEERQPKYWNGVVLSKEAYEWADSIDSTLEANFLIVNPLSVASNTMADHWPFWGPAIKWMADNMTCQLVLVGENMIEWERHPNIVNVSGTSSSMMDVLALAERSAGIVTTGNNLGHYSIIAQKNAVVAFARTCPKRSFYHRYNEHPLLSLVEFEEPMCDFQRAVSERFPQFMTDTVETNEVHDILTEGDYYRETAQV